MAFMDYKNPKYGSEITTLKDVQLKEVKLEDGIKESDTRKDILEKAINCVCGQREQDYGSPENNFQTIADFWNTYLGCTHLTSTDVSMMMALLKIARIKNGGGTGDSFVDLAGYAACGGELNGKK